MDVQVTFRNLSVSNPLRNYAVEKLTRLKRFLIKPTEVQVTLSQEGFRHIAEAQLHAAGGPFSGREENEDMYAAIDVLVDKLAKQARRHKDRARSHKASPMGMTTLDFEERNAGMDDGRVDAEQIRRELGQA